MMLNNSCFLFLSSAVHVVIEVFFVERSVDGVAAPAAASVLVGYGPRPIARYFFFCFVRFNLYYYPDLVFKGRGNKVKTPIITGI